MLRLRGRLDSESTGAVWREAVSLIRTRRSHELVVDASGLSTAAHRKEYSGRIPAAATPAAYRTAWREAIQRVVGLFEVDLRLVMNSPSSLKGRNGDVTRIAHSFQHLVRGHPHRDVP